MKHTVRLAIGMITMESKVSILTSISRIGLIFTVIILANCVSSSFDDVSSIRTGLAANLKSYMSIKDAEKQLGISVKRWKVIEDTKIRGSIFRAAYHMYTVGLEKYRLFNTEGQLRLSFFNNRLMKTQFYPEDFRSFAISLKKEIPKFEIGHELRIAPFTKVNVVKDPIINRWFIIWSDSRLSEQLLDWIGRYS